MLNNCAINQKRIQYCMLPIFKFLKNQKWKIVSLCGIQQLCSIPTAKTLVQGTITSQRAHCRGQCYLVFTCCLSQQTSQTSLPICKSHDIPCMLSPDTTSLCPQQRCRICQTGLQGPAESLCPHTPLPLLPSPALSTPATLASLCFPSGAGRTPRAFTLQLPLSVKLLSRYFLSLLPHFHLICDQHPPLSDFSPLRFYPRDILFFFVHCLFFSKSNTCYLREGTALCFSSLLQPQG